MSATLLNSFLANYVMSLFERTRSEKTGIKIGFDWVIYNLGLAQDWVPVRLPFLRDVTADAAKTKTEPEFGVDVSFLTPAKDTLVVFVLKDEVLNNKNWNNHGFLNDLSAASTPDLTSNALQTVKTVRVILAYNKDEDQTGIKLYNNFVSSRGSTIGDSVSLVFDRWNLTKLVEEVKENLLSPQLLPQHLSGILSYLCSQVADFDYGSVEWENQLLPNWKNFLKTILEGTIDERKLRVIPVTLLILDHYKKETPDSRIGWLDLNEWAMLSLWGKFAELKNDNLKQIVIQIWLNFYISSLEQYFLEIEPLFGIEHGFHSARGEISLTPIIDANIAFWHIGRLGILTLAPQDFDYRGKEELEKMISSLTARSADWLVKGLNLNPSFYRPLLDINHIELFLIWLVLWQAGKNDDIYEWLSVLEMRLSIRRLGENKIPFIEGRSQIELVAEYAVTGEKPPEFTANTSYLLLMLIELCFSLDDEKRDLLLDKYYNRLINGIGENKKPLNKDSQSVDLLWWSSPIDWHKRIFSEQVSAGTGVTTDNYRRVTKKDKPLPEKIIETVTECREKFPFELPNDFIKAPAILACIKNKSPLPSEFWRGTVFPKGSETS